MPKQYIIMEDLGYELIDLHEHEFQKNGLSVEYGTIDSLYDFAGIRVSDLDLIQVDGITFRLPNLRQFLKIYQASSKDSYRNDNNNNKDFKKNDFLKKHIQLRVNVRQVFFLTLSGAFTFKLIYIQQVIRELNRNKKIAVVKNHLVQQWEEVR